MLPEMQQLEICCNNLFSHAVNERWQGLTNTSLEVKLMVGGMKP
jgi:hypothetical protein